jgi:hypothetical protein
VQVTGAEVQRGGGGRRCLRINLEEVLVIRGWMRSQSMISRMSLGFGSSSQIALFHILR